MPFRLIDGITQAQQIRMKLLTNIEVNEQQSQGECGGYKRHQQIVE